MSDLIAITYDDDRTAFAALDKLGELQKMQLITLEDVAVAVNDEKGRVNVKQTSEKMHAGSAASRGFFWASSLACSSSPPSSVVS